MDGPLLVLAAVLRDSMNETQCSFGFEENVVWYVWVFVTRGGAKTVQMMSLGDLGMAVHDKPGMQNVKSDP